MLENKEYQEYIKKTSPKTSQIKTLLAAFLVGGGICVFAQGIFDIYQRFLSLKIDEIGALTSMTMIVIGALCTGLGFYDKIGYFAGAGSIIPITGFANSIVAPAMEFHSEGVIYGLMAKMFTIAGPVIVSGITSSVLIGVIYYIVGLF